MLEKLKNEDFILSEIVESKYKEEIKDASLVKDNSYAVYEDFKGVILQDLIECGAYVKKDEVGSNWYYFEYNNKFYSLGY